MEFGASSGSDAESLAEQIVAFVEGFKGVYFAGLSSDAPATMVGKSNGVGELLCRKFGRFIRHDTCEHHASACVARVIENLFPAQINVLSVTQFCFLAWYLLNTDWMKMRMIMHVQLGKSAEQMDDGIAAMLRRKPDRVIGETVEAAAARLLASSDLNKPEKPNSNRWGTQARMILYVERFMPLLRVVFDEVRELGGSGAATPASVEAMATQWVKWSGSPKLSPCC